MVGSSLSENICGHHESGSFMKRFSFWLIKKAKLGGGEKVGAEHPPAVGLLQVHMASSPR